jgi:hypothetical protein
MRITVKILLRILGGIVLFFVLSVVAIPLMFRDEVIELVRRAADHRIEGAFYFQKAEVGLLSTFPNLCLRLDRPVLTGTTPETGDTLFSADRLDLILNLRSVLKRSIPVKITGIVLRSPHLFIAVDSLGETNYMLISSSGPSGDTTHRVVVEVDTYDLTDGTIRYRDLPEGLDVLITGLEHSGSIRYTDGEIAMKARTDNAVIRMVYGGIPYLSDIAFSGEHLMEIDLEESLYTFDDNRFRLNAMALDLDGSIRQDSTGTVFDLVFNGQRSTFKDLLSLLPNIYSSDFTALKADGLLELRGTLKGLLSDTDYPVYDMVLDVDHGAFSYPDKPFGFTEVAFHADIVNGPAGWQPVRLNLAPLHFQLNHRSVEGNVLVQDPAGAAKYRGFLRGSINLADLMKAYPLSADALEGFLDADVSFDIAAGRDLANQQFSGQITLRDIFTRSDNETFTMRQNKTTFSPALIQTSTQSAVWNGSPVQADLQVRNYIAWLTTGDEMIISGNLSLAKLDMNRYLTSDDSSEDLSPSIKMFSELGFDGDVRIDTLIYEGYVITEGASGVKGTLENLGVSDMRGMINGTRFSANGRFTGIDDYLTGTAPVHGILDCSLDEVFLNRWIDETVAPDGTGKGGTTTYIALPSDLRLDITFEARAAYYDRVRIDIPRGRLSLQDRILEIRDLTGSAMGGYVRMSGLYNTQEPAHPGFNLKYDLSSLRFNDAFDQVETFRILAPVSKWVEGVFNSTLIMEGRLGERYLPDLETLSAAGFLETMTSKIDQADIFTRLSQFLNLRQPLVMDVSHTRNWFEVKEGYVILQEATKSLEDITISYGGRHKIRGEMDYLIKLDIPSKKISSNPVGALAQTGYAQLKQKASSYGVQLANIDRFIVFVSVKGRIADPKFEIVFLDVSGNSLKDVAAQQLASIKEQVRDTVTRLGEQKLRQAKDTVSTTVHRGLDTATSRAEQLIKESGSEILSRAGGKLDTIVRDSVTGAVLEMAGERAKEVLGEKAGKEVDKLKNTLDKWDPFKKKKKD